MSVFPMAEKQEIVQPEQLHFKDDGVYPGSVLPVLLYRAAITADAQDRASVFERGFAQNDWRNSWRNGVYSFAHYHSTSHEALGVYVGSARLRLGGEHGQTVDIRSGDVILIPAGVAHHHIGASPDWRRDHRADVLDQLDLDAHAEDGEHDVREHHGCVDVVSADRLQRHLGAELRLRDDVEEPVVLPKLAVLGERAARLAHEPDRRALDRLAPARPHEKRFHAT